MQHITMPPVCIELLTPRITNTKDSKDNETRGMWVGEINLLTLARVWQQHADEFLQQTKYMQKHTLTLLEQHVRCGVVIPPLPPKICEMSGIGCCLVFTSWQLTKHRCRGLSANWNLEDFQMSSHDSPGRVTKALPLNLRVGTPGNVFLRSTEMYPNVKCK